MLGSSEAWAQDPAGAPGPPDGGPSAIGSIIRELTYPAGESTVNGIAFQNGGPSGGAALWVTGFTTKKIYKMDFSSGSVLSSFTIPGAISPSDLAWDGTNLWETDFGTNLVTKFNPSGTVLASFNCPGTSSGCEGIASDGANLFIGNALDGKIYKVSPVGAVISSFTSPGGASGADGLGFIPQTSNLAILGYDNFIYTVTQTGVSVGSFSLGGGSYNGGDFDGVNFWVGNDGTGKLQQINIGAPVTSCHITMNKAAYVNGDNLIAQTVSVSNGLGIPLPIEYKFWIDLPSGGTYLWMRGGADDSVVLSGFANIPDALGGPVTLANINSGIPRGSYNMNCRLENPVSGQDFVFDRTPFTIN